MNRITPAEGITTLRIAVSVLAVSLCVFILVSNAGAEDNPADILTDDELTGHFIESRAVDFVQVDPNYTNHTIKMYLRKEAFAAFIAMYEDAKSNGIKLTVLSATRNYYEQRDVWESKWSGRKLVDGRNLSLLPDPVERAKGILLYSSMPGTSRHHWGTDIDIVSLDNSYFDTPEGIKTYNWLQNNAHLYGFYQPYISGRGVGYREEKWHWSYIPLSRFYLKQYVYRFSYSDITGFSGAQTAQSLKILENFVIGINPACLPDNLLPFTGPLITIK